MTNTEFDTQFDIFYNNIASNAAPSVDAYEKSVFLTQAQKDVIIGVYNGKDTPGLSFESTEESRRYLSNLVKTHSIDSFEELIELPEDLWFIVREEVERKYNTECSLREIIVVPTTLDNLTKTLNNPFKQPSKNKVLRVDLEGKIKLYSNTELSKYTITYIKKPNPIILQDLDEGLTIEGKSNQTESDVNPLLHSAILSKAVSLAKMAYIGQ